MLKKENEISKAIKWADKNLVGKKVYHPDIGKKVEFTKKGIKHTARAKSYSLKVELIYHAVSLLKSSRLYRIEKDKKLRGEITRIFRLSTIWKYKGVRYFVYIIVRETKNKRYYYDHGVVKKIEP